MVFVYLINDHQFGSFVGISYFTAHVPVSDKIDQNFIHLQSFIKIRPVHQDTGCF